jgi:hypothetical protein
MSAGLAPLSPRADAAMLGTGKKGCTEPEESQSLLVVHTRACFATSQLGPHWTTRCSSEIAKAADACGTLGDAGESYTELCEVDTLEGKGGNLLCFDVM